MADIILDIELTGRKEDVKGSMRVAEVVQSTADRITRKGNS